jgi:VWFA-related protein
MKKYSATSFCLILVCLLFANGFAQSRRAAPALDIDNGKMNKRPEQAAATPKPEALQPEDEPNNTNIERVLPKVEADSNAESDAEVITVNTEMVSVPVKILDRKGRFVSGLTKENFQILEDNLPQEITYFSNEQQPFTVALVLDMSYSATFKIAEIHSAAMAFVSQLRPNDKVMVVAFNEEVMVLTQPTNDRKVLQTAIKSTAIGSGTSLYEAIDLVINEKLKKIAGRKAIVLFTDGVDTTSRRANDMNNLSDALELDALVYPIKYDTFNDVQALKNKPVIAKQPIPSPIPSQNKSPFPFPFPTTGVGTPSSQGTSAEDYRRADTYLNEMANRTGGRLYQANTTANLAQAFSNIAAELREYYSLGYYPKEEAKTAGKKHRLKVRVDKDDLVVRARDSYVVGGKEKKDKRGK